MRCYSLTSVVLNTCLYPTLGTFTMVPPAGVSPIANKVDM
ncbi:hypothetical protein E1A91_A12G047900v1 [Gossypium mustelinum]|uniref:Uncharacterized protein n=1 Tax=Gossypium mustelinum TaxID=34275 RepID=A0A5D2WRV2_GOSMU|nr:hypothetical protein E1A91_A12G047900v1 [Gossypium mustelinum]